MKRLFPSLVCAVGLSLLATTSASSETALEMLDRVQKQLQADHEKDKNKSEPNGATTPEQRQRAAAYQTTAFNLGRMRQYLASGDKRSASRIVSQEMLSLGVMGGALPDEVRVAFAALSERVNAEKTEEETAFAKEVDAARKWATEAVYKANEPKDLDAALANLTTLSNNNPANELDGRSVRTVAVQTAVTFLNRWQDYLLARNRKNDTGVKNILQSLADVSNTEQASLIPRSEILARIPKSEIDPDAERQRSRPMRPQPQIDAEAAAIIQGVKTFEGISDALSKLIALREEVSAYRTYNQSSDSVLGASLTGLQALQRTFLELRNGLTSTLNLNDYRVNTNNFPEVGTILASLRLELLKMAVPRLLGASENEKAKADEPLDTFLRRLIQQAKERQDWSAVVRGLELKRTLATVSADPSASNRELEVSAFRSFFAGRNLETANQGEQAVVSYLDALRSGQEDIPSALIGERLSAIQQAHPKEYAAGMERARNSARTSSNGELPAGEENSLYRGLHDPRYPGRPGYQGAPGEDKLAVPAVSPSPEPAKPVPSVAPNASPTPAR